MVEVCGSRQRIHDETWFKRTWGKLRDYQLIDPIHYGLGLTYIKGVASYYADASAAEVSTWSNAVYDGLEKAPYLTQFIFNTAMFERKMLEFRNQRTVERLARIAIEMDKVSERKPILAYMGGLAHLKGISRILDDNGIPFQAKTFYPNRRRRKYADHVRDAGHALLPIINSSLLNYEKLWKDNIAAHTHST
ncbi:hypothetical protein IPL68_00560 [Candidatus Saccharibacteria bacterium]|nr:MAG: hypothetical protein IPL68_00560 [Candidatus Saccharibacteria bacterium]